MDSEASRYGKMDHNERQSNELPHEQQRWLSIADREHRIASSHLSIYDETIFPSSLSLSFGTSSVNGTGTEEGGDGSRIPRGWGDTRDFAHDIIPVDPALLAQELEDFVTEEEASTILQVISKPIQAISKPITSLLVQPVFQFCITFFSMCDEVDKMEVVEYTSRLAEENDSVDNDNDDEEEHFLVDLPARFLPSTKGFETRDRADTSEEVENVNLLSNGSRRVLLRVPNFSGGLQGAVHSDGGRFLLAISKRCMPWQDNCTHPQEHACEGGNSLFASLAKANASLSERLKSTKSFCMLPPSVPRLWQRESVE